MNTVFNPFSNAPLPFTSYQASRAEKVVVFENEFEKKNIHKKIKRDQRAKFCQIQNSKNCLRSCIDLVMVNKCSQVIMQCMYSSSSWPGCMLHGRVHQALTAWMERDEDNRCIDHLCQVQWRRDV